MIVAGVPTRKYLCGSSGQILGGLGALGKVIVIWYVAGSKVTIHQSDGWLAKENASSTFVYKAEAESPTEHYQIREGPAP